MGTSASAARPMEATGLARAKSDAPAWTPKSVEGPSPTLSTKLTS